MNALLTYPTILLVIATILGGVLWLYIGLLITRSEYGQGDMIAMIAHDLPWVGIFYLFVSVVLWPLMFVIQWAMIGYFLVKVWFKTDQEKLTLTTTPDARASLQALQAELDSISLSELFRRAIGSYHFIVDEKKKGACFYMIDAQGEHHPIDFP